MPTNVRDPRTLITPDAFELDRELLGVPLANPWRRLGAMLLDLLIIAIVSAFLESIELFVWGTAGLFVLWVAFQKPGRSSQTVGILLRLSAGCLGLAILATVLVFGLVLTFDDDADSGPVRGDLPAVSAPAAPDARREEPATEAEEAAPPPAETADAAAAGALPDPAEMSDQAVLAELAQRLETDPPPADSTETRVRYRALRARAAPLVAGDTIEALAARVGDLQDDVEHLREERAELERALERERGDLTTLLADIWDQAGSAIGIWSLYFTVLLTLWNGRTVGKRVMGLRVLRLDGRTMGWWEAFERAGGYVAGLATGLLGFAQIFWDPNRQCIHDKIVGTVVVRDGAEPIHGAWQEAAGAPSGWTPDRSMARVGRGTRSGSTGAASAGRPGGGAERSDDGETAFEDGKG